MIVVVRATSDSTASMSSAGDELAPSEARRRRLRGSVSAGRRAWASNAAALWRASAASSPAAAWWQPGSWNAYQVHDRQSDRQCLALFKDHHALIRSGVGPTSAVWAHPSLSSARSILTSDSSRPSAASE